MKIRSALIALLVGAALHPTIVWAADEAAPPPATDGSNGSDAAKEAAKKHFEAGLALLKKNAYDAALVEFTQSIEAFPNRSATENAGVCLRELERFDEADEMFAEVLRLPDLPDEVRARVVASRSELENKIGELSVTGGEPGAMVTVDGRPRGKLPLERPLKVAAGSHTVRVHLEGYVPFVDSIQIVPRKRKSIDSKLEVLARAGRLRIGEKSEAIMFVFIDGVNVGATPWEGALEPGDHAVWLEGARDQGTAPILARVLLGQRTALVVAARPLDSGLDVEVTPATAMVAIDGVPVGKGHWHGRLPAGQVEVSVSAPGYDTAKQNVTLPTLGRGKASVSLKAAAYVPPEGAGNAELLFDFALGAVPVLTADPCSDSCGSGPGFGLEARGRAGYRFPFGLALGGQLGFLRATNSVEGIPISLNPFGEQIQKGTRDDSTTIGVGAFEAYVSYRFDSEPFVDLDLAAGGFVGAAKNERTIDATDSKKNSFEVGPYDSSGTVAGVILEPEVRLGGHLVPEVTMSGGLGASILGALVAPRFRYDTAIPVGSDGAAKLPEGDILQTIVASIRVSLGVGIEL